MTNRTAAAQSARRLAPTLVAIGATAVAVAVAACSADSTGVGPRSSQIAFSATKTSPAGATFSAVPITVGGHTLDLTSITVTVARIELKRAQADACPGDDDNDDDHPSQTPSTNACGELKVGPVTVTIPVDGGMVTLPANTIPAGTYRAFDVRVSQVELKGTFDTKTFDVTLPVHATIENTFSTPLVVADSAPTTITINLTTAGWFLNGDGSLIDPGQLSASASLQARIRNNIAASLRAFEDRDHDGRDDHGGKD